MKRIVMMVVAGCAIGLLTGCGVPQEEHDAKIAELNAAWEEIETLKGKSADLESLLNKERGQVRNARIELDDASKRISELTEKEAAAANALADEKGKVSKLEGDLAAAQSAVEAAKDQISELEAALAALQEETQRLQKRFTQFERNMNPSGSASTLSTAPKAGGSDKSSSERALDLLNKMGAQ